MRQTNDLSAGALRSPTFVGKVFSRPGALGGLGLGREQGFDARHAKSFQSRRPKASPGAAAMVHPFNHAGAGYHVPI
ncbi:hypothetical protein UNPA324_04600 [Bradyrhizobium sp. UNPA324]|nr:hypothetical protein UNPA324_04600 [Bradyrhizobium sp. UNPA324]